jgi:hypothetical protein
VWDVLQKCAENAQIQNNPTLKWGTHHNGKYVVASKINCYPNIEVQNNTLIKMRINYGLFVSLVEGDEIPLALLYHIDATSTCWAFWHVNTPWLANVAFIASTTHTSLVVCWTLKQQHNITSIAYETWNQKFK